MNVNKNWVSLFCSCYQQRQKGRATIEEIVAVLCVSSARTCRVSCFFQTVFANRGDTWVGLHTQQKMSVKMGRCSGWTSTNVGPTWYGADTLKKAQENKFGSQKCKYDNGCAELEAGQDKKVQERRLSVGPFFFRVLHTMFSHLRAHCRPLQVM